jgi:hypothetical protein
MLYSPCQNGIRAGAPGAGVTIHAVVLDGEIRRSTRGQGWKTSPTPRLVDGNSVSSPVACDRGG